MKIKTKVNFKEYVKLLFSLAYEKTILRLLLGVAFLILLWIIFFNLEIFDLPKPLIYQYVTLILIAVVQPTGLYLTMRRTYKSSNQLQETSEFVISPNDFKINGESYYMEVKWEKLFKIVEKRNWFLLYQNSLSAILIPKKDMSATDIKSFRQIVKGINDVPVELLDTKGLKVINWS
ncbi:MAG: YcxB family protein [Gelidibacter sp.]